MNTPSTANANPSTPSAKALRLVLVALGAASTFVAFNVAFGGLETLGLQGSTTYFDVTDHEAYLLRDSHARFYGGVYLAIGLYLIVASGNLLRHRSALIAVFSMIFLGGVARLSQGQLGVTFGKDLAASTLIELIAMPALALWLTATTTQPRNTGVLTSPSRRAQASGLPTPTNP